MPRAIIMTVVLLLMVGARGASAQETGERRPDIKITRERKTRFNKPPVKDPVPHTENNKKASKESLSNDDAQVIANMEFLQNMDLLQNYDKVTLMRLFTPSDQKMRAQDKTAKDQKKGQRSDEKNTRN